MGRKRHSSPGHFCWCCGRRRPNERFSGRNHARHLCRDCSRLGEDELVYRQHLRDIERLLGCSGRIERKQRASFERYLSHRDPRVRAHAREIEQRQRAEAREWRAISEADELAFELVHAAVHAADDSEGLAPSSAMGSGDVRKRRGDGEGDDDGDEEIPF